MRDSDICVDRPFNDLASQFLDLFISVLYLCSHSSVATPEASSSGTALPSEIIQSGIPPSDFNLQICPKEASSLTLSSPLILPLFPVHEQPVAFIFSLSMIDFMVHQHKYFAIRSPFICPLPDLPSRKQLNRRRSRRAGTQPARLSDPARGAGCAVRAPRALRAGRSGPAPQRRLLRLPWWLPRGASPQDAEVSPLRCPRPALGPAAHSRGSRGPFRGGTRRLRPRGLRLGRLRPGPAAQPPSVDLGRGPGLRSRRPRRPLFSLCRASPHGRPRPRRVPWSSFPGAAGPSLCGCRPCPQS